MTTPSSRRGRPPDADSAATRARIITCARRRFAGSGYDATKVRAIAEDAGLSTTALYHYFTAKLDLFGAVYGDTQDLIYNELERATTGVESFAERVRITLDLSYLQTRNDPWPSRFLSSCRIDAHRNPALRPALQAGGTMSRWQRYLQATLDLGVSTGEIRAEDREMIGALLQAIMVGLANAVAHDETAHRQAIDGFLALLDGELLQRPPSTA